MHFAVKRIGWLLGLMSVVFAFSLAGSSAKAQDVRSIGQKVVREKILHDGRDRYDIKFTITDTLHTAKRMVWVTGNGSFRRRGKPSQMFHYRVLINPKTRLSSDVSYNIR